MNILFIVPYIPNLIRVRSYNLIRSLTELGNRVTVMTLVKNEDADITQLADQCYQVVPFDMPLWRSMYNTVSTLPTKIPLQVNYSWQPRLAQESVRIINNGSERQPFEVIHVEHLRGARYGLHLKQSMVKLGTRIPVIWDSVDCISYLFDQAATLSTSIFSRWLTRFELGRTRSYERHLMDQFDHILVTSKIDMEELRKLAPTSRGNSNISVLSNGVDLEYFAPDERVERDDATLVVSGKMSYHANVTMVAYLVNDIMPLVWDRHPDVKLMIVGKDPTDEIRAFSNNPAITVTGTVEDIRPYLQRATISLAPIRYGAGVQNKVIEAMACGTPVISTRHATSGLDTKAGIDIWVADGASEFASKILQMLDDKDAQRRLSDAGRIYVERHHDWNQVAKKLVAIYQQSVQGVGTQIVS